MAELGFKESAAVNRIAAVLALHVTNAIIDELARELGFRSLQASNKTKKIGLMLTDLLADGLVCDELVYEHDVDCGRWRALGSCGVAAVGCTIEAPASRGPDRGRTR